MMTLLIHTDWQERFVKVDCDNVALASFLNPNCLFFQFPDRWQEPLLPVFDHLNLARSNTMAFERHSKTTFLIFSTKWVTPPLKLKKILRNGSKRAKVSVLGKN